ncbi:hypothetical protein D3C78_1821070 [compost metagenome]
MEKSLIDFLNKVTKLSEEHNLVVSAVQYDEKPVTNKGVEKPTLTIAVKLK